MKKSIQNDCFRDDSFFASLYLMANLAALERMSFQSSLGEIDEPIVTTSDTRDRKTLMLI